MTYACKVCHASGWIKDYIPGVTIDDGVLCRCEACYSTVLAEAVRKHLASVDAFQQTELGSLGKPFDKMCEDRANLDAILSGQPRVPLVIADIFNSVQAEELRSAHALAAARTDPLPSAETLRAAGEATLPGLRRAYELLGNVRIPSQMACDLGAYARGQCQLVVKKEIERVKSRTGATLGAASSSTGDPLADLVSRFSAALLAKLRSAHIKRDNGHAWLFDGWSDDLRQDIRAHLDKGDPLDVAAYAAFAWHHGWSLASGHVPMPINPTPEILRSMQDAQLGEYREEYSIRSDKDARELYDWILETISGQSVFALRTALGTSGGDTGKQHGNSIDGGEVTP